MSKKSGVLSSPMNDSVRKADGPMPCVKGAETSGMPAPFNLPHSKGPNVIPVIFKQSNLKGESGAEILNSPIQGMNANKKTRKD